jgi:hypothetical protein|tara:strand:- start:149 stop:592 length:444 start_codon:yes stop_codon:yes gene_type:complete
MAESIKSRFKPLHPSKYQGNPDNIICRSSWERKFCQWCDRNNSIIYWASEEISIPYVSPKDNRVHRYYPDFVIKVKEKNSKIKTYVVEVKPKKQTLPPKPRKRVSKSYIYECTTYEVNKAKWKAASEYCKDHLIEFKIVTEDELGIK